MDIKFEKLQRWQRTITHIKQRWGIPGVYNQEYEEFTVDDYPESEDGSYFNDDYDLADAESKAVLNVVPQEESEMSFDNQLDFTPYYYYNKLRTF